jgi:hypothetical protein
MTGSSGQACPPENLAKIAAMWLRSADTSPAASVKCCHWQPEHHNQWVARCWLGFSLGETLAGEVSPSG